MARSLRAALPVALLVAISTAAQEPPAGEAPAAAPTAQAAAGERALVSENWCLPGADDGYILSGAVRFIGQRLGVDAGLVFVQGADVPVPWLDFTFSFGQR